MRTQKTGAARDNRSQMKCLLPAGTAIAAAFRGNAIISEKTKSEKQPPVNYSGFSCGVAAKPVVWSATIFQPTGNFLKTKVNTPSGLSFARSR